MRHLASTCWASTKPVGLSAPEPPLNSARHGSVESPGVKAKLTMLSRVINV